MADDKLTERRTVILGTIAMVIIYIAIILFSL